MLNEYSIPLLVLGAVNFIAFVIVAVDKRKSTTDGTRVPEVYFFVWSVFFASLGVLLGMFVFRHKTKKVYFPLGIGVLLLEQVFLLKFLAERYIGGV